MATEENQLIEPTREEIKATFTCIINEIEPEIKEPITSATCLICGSNDTYTTIETEIFEYKGIKIPVDNYELLNCNNCEEAMATKESRSRGELIVRGKVYEIDSKGTAI